MKVCRVTHSSFAGPRYALVEDSRVRLLDESKLFEQVIVATDGHSFSLEEVQLLAPVRPSKIVCVGRNYREHAAELGNEVPTEPLLFFKPTSSLNAPGGTIC